MAFCVQGVSKIDLSFFLNSALLGVGLAMDAFSVSMANAMVENKMKIGRMCAVSGVYAAFQAAMPLAGWAAVRFAAQKFAAFSRAVPYIALVLLLYIGIKMLYDGLKNKSEKEQNVKFLTTGVLLMQGVATSIDALSVGFTISRYTALPAATAAAIISAVTFVVCFAGLCIGKRFGTLFKNRAYTFGGIILIAIGAEIFLKGVIK